MEWREKERPGRLRLMAVFICMGIGVACGVNAAAGERAPQAAVCDAPCRETHTELLGMKRITRKELSLDWPCTASL